MDREIKELEARIIEFLMTVPGLDDRGNRNSLLNGLPSSPSDSIVRFNSVISDLSSIVKNVIKFGKLASNEKLAIEILLDNVELLVTGLEKKDSLDKIIQDLRELKKASLIVSRKANQVHNLPQKRNNFVGRKKEIKLLLSRLSDNYRQYLHTIKGIGGVGKTALVLEVAYMCLAPEEYPDDEENIPYFDTIIFTSSKATNLVDTAIIERPEKEPTLSAIFRVISEALREPSITQVPVDEQIGKVSRVLANRKVLLIVDNMETLIEEEHNKILAFLDNVPGPTQVIITTREPLGITALTLSSLTKKESSRLIVEQSISKQVKISRSDRSRLAERCGGIPIALIYVIGRLAAGSEISDVLQFDKKLVEELGGFCFASSVNPLRGTAAYNLLLSMNFFQDPPCREALIKTAGFSEETQEIRNSLTKLQQLSLVLEVEKSKRLRILPITREYIGSELGKLEDPDFRAEITMMNEWNKLHARQLWIDWYLEFAQQYGGLDWENWRARYDRLSTEWGNIESVLEFCVASGKWDQVLGLWDNIDNYVDLNGYWQKRLDWWTTLADKIGNPEQRAKALAQRAWTMFLMGEEYHSEAKKSLDEAWGLRGSATVEIQAIITSYYAISAKSEKIYSKAREWLEQEAGLLKNSQLPEKDRVRCWVRHYYYLAEIDYLERDTKSARRNFRKSMKLGEKVGWQRFVNYARNGLANTLIDENLFAKAEPLLEAGLKIAENMREPRRIALYQSSFARFYWKIFQQSAHSSSFTQDIQEQVRLAKDFGNKALQVFVNESMVDEQAEIRKVISLISRWSESKLREK